ncbi:hypothetical protein LMT13_27485, partial [Escherichia coli]|uniref:hypothetical protein n=1 Tax=Escherichia coli TaxID=562 RepID=UPI001E334800
YCSYGLEFHIFDIPSDKVWWGPETESGRCKDLMDAEDTITTLMLDHIKVVDAELAYTVDHCEESVGVFMSEGYEGTIMRNFCGKYEYGQRTSEALKWKKFNDAEVKVIDVEKDKNDEGVLICVDKEGIVVKMKMKGTHEERSYDRMQEMIGKFVTFKYQSRTEDNNYQFPVGICVRNVDPDTWEVLE